MRDRRSFVKSGLAAGATLTTGVLPHVTAQEAQLPTKLVSLDAGIEPLVRLIETTPRGDLIEVMARQVMQGVSYQEVLASLLLAGVRNVQPRPAVGFKFHSVLVVNSAHLASLASPDQDRWLPIFWALDYFKATQLEEERKTGWKLGPVAESRVPTATQARAAFTRAMDEWDAEAADAAIAGLVRTAGANELFELFCRYGARDFRSIGHKAIYVANSFRTLECIGWQHAEPVLRSLTYALQNHTDEDNPSRSDYRADRPWRSNVELQTDIADTWQAGKLDAVTSRELIAELRDASEADSPAAVVEALNRGVAPRSIWDAIFVGSGELLMRQPGIIGLHSLTTANALHYAYQRSGDDSTRRLLLLQASAFLPMFRQSALDRGKLDSSTFEAIAESSPADHASLDDIFSDVSRNRKKAATEAMAYLEQGGSPFDFLDEARRLVFLKGTDAHDYKYSSAVLEDYYHVSPAFQPTFLALSVFNLRGAGDKDNQLNQRIRSAMS